MLRLYNKFPRQIALPTRRQVNNKEEMLHYVNKYNQITRIWVSVYNYIAQEQDKDLLDVDKIFFDLDDEKTMFADICVLHDYCLKNNLRHIMFFSGRGFHFYLMTKNYDQLQNKKQALTNAHHFFVKALNVKIDEHIIGDIARVATFPNTWNGKRRRFCIPIDEVDLANGYDFIREKALGQQFNYRWYGWELYDISRHDSETNGDFELVQLTPEQKRRINENKVLRELPPCLSRVLTKEHVGWRDRFLVICYLRDKGYMKPEVLEILSKFLSTRDFRHCIQEERQVDVLFRRQEYMFPNCENLRLEGYCLSKRNCSASQRLYK